MEFIAKFIEKESRNNDKPYFIPSGIISSLGPLPNEIIELFFMYSSSTGLQYICIERKPHLLKYYHYHLENMSLKNIICTDDPIFLKYYTFYYGKIGTFVALRFATDEAKPNIVKYILDNYMSSFCPYELKTLVSLIYYEYYNYKDMATGSLCQHTIKNKQKVLANFLRPNIPHSIKADILCMSVVEKDDYIKNLAMNSGIKITIMDFYNFVNNHGCYGWDRLIDECQFTEANKSVMLRHAIYDEKPKVVEFLIKSGARYDKSMDLSGIKKEIIDYLHDSTRVSN